MIEYENLQKSNKWLEEEYKAAFSELLQSGHYILGEKLKQFEESFSTYCHTSHCVGVGNGFDALVLSLKSFDFPKGSEIIVPCHTFIATILAVLHCGLKPVLAEPLLDTYNIDPSKIEEYLTPNAKAIIPVHMYGKMCDMSSLTELAQKHDLKIIEDCAQAHGATYLQKRAGSFGHLGAFSFYPVKNLGALGDGGAITLQDPILYEKIRKLRNYGSTKKYYSETIGLNSRLDELQAAMLLVKLKKLDEIIEYKRKLASVYFDNLREDFVTPVQDEANDDAFHIFAIRHPRREELRQFLLNKGVKTEIHYPVPPHKQVALKEVFEGQSFPITEQIHDTVLSLPLSFGHTVGEIEQVCGILNAF